MPMIATTLVALVAAIHVYILVVEMFLWTTPYGRKVFGSTRRPRGGWPTVRPPADLPR